MKCQRCHVNEASVKIMRIVNGEKQELYLSDSPKLLLNSLSNEAG